MAKRLLLNVLVEFLGEYVEGLTEENLKVGVWNGKIGLENLQLNRKTLQNWNLPISVTHGSVKVLEVIIPWATLESNPVKVVLDGVYLQVGPLDASTFNSSELRKQAFTMKRQKLMQAEKSVILAAQMMVHDDQREKVKNTTYIERLTTKVIDNIELKLQNVHIRYEDSRTMPGHTFSAGITLDSFVVTTTDKNWVEKFVARKLDSALSSIYKMATMTNLGIYWNSSETQPLADLTFSTWEKVMSSLIYNKFNESVSLGYILSPPNNLSVRVVHNENAPESIPKLDISVASTDLPMKLDHSQYDQLLCTANIFAALDQQKLLLLHRPVCSPKEDHVGWWRYAVKLVTKRDDIFSKKVSNSIYEYDRMKFNLCSLYLYKYIFVLY